ncbi:hypothetical protein GCM10023238_13830 [Streptomyces heliomycini]
MAARAVVVARRTVPRLRGERPIIPSPRCVWRSRPRAVVPHETQSRAPQSAAGRGGIRLARRFRPPPAALLGPGSCALQTGMVVRAAGAESRTVWRRGAVTGAAPAVAQWQIAREVARRARQHAGSAQAPRAASVEATQATQTDASDDPHRRPSRGP